MATLICQIKECIERKLDAGFRKFIIFPFGDIGMQVKGVLKSAYGIEAEYVLDNNLYKYNSDIKALDFLDKVSCKEFCVVLASTNPDIYRELKRDLQRYFVDENIAELSSMVESQLKKQWYTKIGKYSYGDICRNHPFIESIGAFSSFAGGTDVVQNHVVQYLTTHPMLYYGAHLEEFEEYSNSKSASWYFDGVQPHRDKVKPLKRIKIGNDVWLGRNVTITNYANIGNGVIAGAGSVITKDVPDYAVVGGVPARIIRFRYSPEEIESLNKIAWWDWTDDEIRERYDDFYLPIDKFIQKYLKAPLIGE